MVPHLYQPRRRSTACVVGVRVREYDVPPAKAGLEDEAADKATYLFGSPGAIASHVTKRPPNLQLPQTTPLC